MSALEERIEMNRHESKSFLHAVQQQSSNANGIVDVFLVDQQQAIQLQSSDYLSRLIAAANGTSGNSTATTPMPGIISFIEGTPTAFSEPAIDFSPGQIFSLEPMRQAQNLPGPASAPAPYGVAPGPLGVPVPLYADPGSDVLLPIRPATYNLAPTVNTNLSRIIVPINTVVRLSPGNRTSIIVNLEDYVGELYVIFYYERSVALIAQPLQFTCIE